MKHCKDYLLESLLDDEEDILDRADHAGLEVVMVDRFNKIDPDPNIDSDLNVRIKNGIIERVEIKGDKLVAYMRPTWSLTKFSLETIDMMYENILSIIDEGYDVTIKSNSKTQIYDYDCGTIRCDTTYQNRTWEESMSRLFKLMSNPKFHMVDKFEIKPSNMTILLMLNNIAKNLRLDFSDIPVVEGVIVHFDPTPSTNTAQYQFINMKTRIMSIRNLAQINKMDKVVLKNCKIDNLYFYRHTLDRNYHYKDNLGFVDLSTSSIKEIHIDKSASYLAPYAIRHIAPGVVKEVEDSFAKRGTKKTNDERYLIGFMNTYFKKHPEFVSKFKSMNCKYIAQVQHETYELKARKNFLMKVDCLDWVFKY